jgi:DNA polymerase-3 subunit delta
MKYQNVATFENHLRQAGTEHVSLIYMIGMPFADERRKIIESIISLLRQKDPGISLTRLDLEEVKMGQLLQALQSPSLFAANSIIVLEKMEQLKKAALEPLLHYFLHPNPAQFLICGCSSMKNLNDLYQKGKKDVVVLDLCEEKPWDRKDRLTRWLKEAAAKEKKTISTDLMSHLIETVGLDFSHLENELRKLICYAGERSEITSADAKALPGFRMATSIWEFADQVVFNRGALTHSALNDLSFLLPLIGQIRGLLQTGCKIAFLRAQGEDRETISRSLPSVRAQMLDKCQMYSENFFKQGLCLLFELELACKSTPTDPVVLFDQFNAKLHLNN